MKAEPRRQLDARYDRGVGQCSHQKQRGSPSPSSAACAFASPTALLAPPAAPLSGLHGNLLNCRQEQSLPVSRPRDALSPGLATLTLPSAIAADRPRQEVDLAFPAAAAVGAAWAMMRAASIAVKPIGHIRVTRVLRLRRDLASDGGLGSCRTSASWLRAPVCPCISFLGRGAVARGSVSLLFLRDRAFQAVIGRYTCPSGGAASGSGPDYASGCRV